MERELKMLEDQKKLEIIEVKYNAYTKVESGLNDEVEIPHVNSQCIVIV